MASKKVRTYVRGFLDKVRTNVLSLKANKINYKDTVTLRGSGSERTCPIEYC